VREGRYALKPAGRMEPVALVRSKARLAVVAVMGGRCAGRDGPLKLGAPKILRAKRNVICRRVIQAEVLANERLKGVGPALSRDFLSRPTADWLKVIVAHVLIRNAPVSIFTPIRRGNSVKYSLGCSRGVHGR
jgi:hypothetical protein